MKMILGLLVAGWLSVTVHADTIQLTTGTNITGRVRGYANGMFEIEGENGKSTRYTAGSIVRIEFEGERAFASVDIRNRGPAKIVVTGLEKGILTILKDDWKTETISLMTVSHADFVGRGKPIEEVAGEDLARYLPWGKVTIVDFYADWCAPCRVLTPQLEKLVKEDPQVVLRKVNVDNLRPLAEKYEVTGIPHVMIFNRRGKLVGKSSGVNFPRIQELVEEAKPDI